MVQRPSPPASRRCLSRRDPLLPTKLYIPPARPHRVLRARLIEKLNAGLDRKLTLVSAPAGFGKTTLLSEWIHCAEAVLPSMSGANKTAWISLDEGDNDPARFWAYFIAALQTIETNVGEAALAMLQSSQRPSSEAILTTLINEIIEVTLPRFQSNVSAALILVLDDYHVIDAQPLHDGLTFFLDHLPPAMHLVIATRVDPPWHLARLRARGQLNELRAADLRFTPGEAVEFMNQVMGLDLSAQDVGTLEARTEGWIAGLQMAALSMQGRDAAQVANFITTFAGSHRYIVDYLAEEVLDKQPETVQRFLLETAILDRLSGQLCDALTGSAPDHPDHPVRVAPSQGRKGTGQSMLERLEEDNLFVVPLDEKRHWYRYHHLFRQVLRQRLNREQPDRLIELHRRASKWYARNGLNVEAMHHALEAGDVTRVADLIEDNALAMLDRGELTTFLRWLDAMPGDVVRFRPWLSVFYAWVLLYTGQLDAIELRLQHAEESLGVFGQHPETHALSQAEAQHLTGHIATIRAYILGTSGDIHHAMDSASQALERLPEKDTMARSFATLLLGNGYRYTGDLVAASRTLSQAITISQSAGDSHLAVMTSCNLATQRIQQGQLHQAAAMFRDVLKHATLSHMAQQENIGKDDSRRLPFAGIAATGLAKIHREWNDLEAATQLVREGLELSKQWGQAEILMYSFAELAQILQVRGDAAGALEMIQQEAQLARELSPWVVAWAAAHQARLWLAQGNIAAASGWARECRLSPDDEVSYQQEAAYRTLARVLLAQDKQDEALSLLARLLNMVEAAGAMGDVIEILILQALALQAKGQVSPALNALERALALAQPEGYIRIFLDEGAPMATLLREAAHHGLYPNYVNELLSALESERQDSTGRQKAASSSPSSPLIESLSDRELEILRLVAAGLSNREIASQLFLAVGTVKKHINNIFGKLNVHKRTQAVARARELHLL